MKLKRVVICLFLIILLCSCSLEKDDKIKVLSKEELIDEIMSYDNNLDYEFLDYIYGNYDNALDKLLSYYKENKNNDSMWHDITGNSLKVLFDYYNDSYSKMDNVKIIDTKDNFTMSFVGDISLADNFDIMPYYDSRNEGVYGILSTEVVDIMKSSDIMVANNEFAVTNSNNRLEKYYNFKAKPERLKIYDEMGVDLVSIANNHVYDYRKDGFLDTLKYLKEYDIPFVGGGKNIEEAKKAYYFIADGYKISFISATRAEKNVVTPNATVDSPGVFWAYDPEELINTIKKEKQVSDFVVVLIHWGREDSTEYEDVQLTTGHKYIDAGADFIIGSHAHVLQGIEMYNGKLIAYNLGDFIFNRESKDTGILSISIDNAANISYEFIPCYQSNYKTTLLDGEDKNKVINKMNSMSINAEFDSDGKFYVNK